MVLINTQSNNKHCMCIYKLCLINCVFNFYDFNTHLHFLKSFGASFDTLCMIMYDTMIILYVDSVYNLA